MQHTIILPANEYASYDTKRHLLTPANPLYEPGDTILLHESNTRNQRTMTITGVDTEHIFKGWCVLGLAAPAEVVRDMPFDMVGLANNILGGGHE
jgi:hypothetical protein